MGRSVLPMARYLAKIVVGPSGGVAKFSSSSFDPRGCW